MSDKYDFISHPNHYNGHVVLGKKLQIQKKNHF